MIENVTIYTGSEIESDFAFGDMRKLSIKTVVFNMSMHPKFEEENWKYILKKKNQK